MQSLVKQFDYNRMLPENGTWNILSYYAPQSIGIRLTRENIVATSAMLLDTPYFQYYDLLHDIRDIYAQLS